jgi:hypothetical protein
MGACGHDLTNPWVAEASRYGRTQDDEKQAARDLMLWTRAGTARATAVAPPPRAALSHGCTAPHSAAQREAGKAARFGHRQRGACGGARPCAGPVGSWRCAASKTGSCRAARAGAVLRGACVSCLGVQPRAGAAAGAQSRTPRLQLALVDLVAGPLLCINWPRHAHSLDKSPTAHPRLRGACTILSVLVASDAAWYQRKQCFLMSYTV